MGRLLTFIALAAVLLLSCTNPVAAQKTATSTASNTSANALTLKYSFVSQGKVTTGRGNTNEPIIRATLIFPESNATATLQGVSGKVKATDLADITALRAYFATNAQELYVDPTNSMPWREQNGEFWAEGKINEDGTYIIEGEKELSSGSHYLWICLDIAPDATEGDTVDLTVDSYTIDGALVKEYNGDPTYSATIFLTESAALMPMDLGSKYYRIPAITTTADGNRLVILTDDRTDTNHDLPTHVWVVAQYSDDGGHSWSKPVKVAGTAELGGDYGHGDASLITDRLTGDIIGIMTSSPYGKGFSSATPSKPQVWKTIRSRDGGLTWEAPVDYSKSLYGKGTEHEDWWGGFSASGAGLQLRDGTLVSPYVVRENPRSVPKKFPYNASCQNVYLIMSKDGGDTWYVSGTSATTTADESKVIERNNGDIAISVRARMSNFTNYTSDEGKTWGKPFETRFTSGIFGNACNGEYMVWCSTLDGNQHNIVLQTKPCNRRRMNVSIALSTDEGETFSAPKTICPRGSAYSAATVLPDGTLGVYYEEIGVFGYYTMRFVRFSLDWASDGKYKFTEENPYHPIQIVGKGE